MKRWTVVLLLAACGGKKEAPPAETKGHQANHPALDVAAVAAAFQSLPTAEDPLAALVAAMPSCRGLAEEKATIECLGGLVKAHADDPSLAALLPVTIWRHEAPAGVQLPEARNTALPRGWAQVIVAKDGAVTVARATRATFGANGAVIDPPAAPVARGDRSAYAALETLGAKPAASPADVVPDVDWNDSLGSDVIYDEETEAKIRKASEAMAKDAAKNKPRDPPAPPRTAAQIGPCAGHGDFGFGLDPDPTGDWGFGPASSWGDSTLPTGRYYTIRPPGVWGAYLRKGPLPVESALVIADSAASAENAFAPLAGYQHVLAVRSGETLRALPFVVCPGGSTSGVVIPLARGAEPKTIYAAYEAAAKQAGHHVDVVLKVDESVTFGEIVAALDTLVDAGASVVELESTNRGGMRSAGHRGPPRLTQTKKRVSSAADSNVIRRHVRRQNAKFLYCYEKQLLVKPALEGDIAVSFVIGADGVVSTARADGVDREVSRCVAEVVKSIAFPKPGEPPVEVEYTFTYRPAGG